MLKKFTQKIWPNRCQFHQRFLCTFFIQIFGAKPNVTRENYVRMKNSYTKCWWNWPQRRASESGDDQFTVPYHDYGPIIPPPPALNESTLSVKPSSYNFPELRVIPPTPRHSEENDWTSGVKLINIQLLCVQIPKAQKDLQLDCSFFFAFGFCTCNSWL